MKLKSVADGFNVIVGSYLTHGAAFLLTLILGIIVQAGSYKDGELSEWDKWLFFLLSGYHLLLGLLKFFQLWKIYSLKIIMPIIMFFIVFLVTEL